MGSNDLAAEGAVEMRESEAQACGDAESPGSWDWPGAREREVGGEGMTGQEACLL